MPGQVVGEVSIKVRPDTTRFSKELRAKLQQVKDDFDIQVGLDTKKALAEFQILKRRIEGDDLDVRVNLKTDKLNLGQQLGSVRQATNGLVSEIDRSKAAFERSSTALQKAQRDEVRSIARLRDAEQKLFKLRTEGLATASRTTRAEADIAVLRNEVAKATQRVARAQDSHKRSMWSYFSALGNSERDTRRFRFSLSSLFEPLKEAGSGFAEVGGKLLSMASNVWVAIAVLAVLGPLMTLLITVIGVLLGALGALVTGIASFGALAGGVFVAVALGLDGIKDAAKALAPEVEHLKNTLNATWRDGLTPVFENLKSLFPIIEEGLNRIAQRLVRFADGMAQFFTSIQGSAMLEQIFRNIDSALDSVLGSLSGLVIELYKVAATKGVMDALGSALSGVVDGITNFIARAREMQIIEPALYGVDKVLRGLLRFLDAVLIAGMEFLATAAPGIQSFFEEWGALLDRINWTDIGAAISDLFERAGQAMSRIPQDTLDKIVLGIEALADSVARFLEQGGMEAIANAFLLATGAMIFFTDALNLLSPIINFVTDLAMGFAQVLEFVKSAFDNVGLVIKMVGQAMIGDWGGALNTLTQITQEKFTETGGIAKSSAADMNKNVVGEVQSMKDRLGPMFMLLPAPVRAAFEQMQNTARTGVKNTAAETGKLPNEARNSLGNVGGILVASGRALVQGFVNGIRGMVGAVRSAASAVVSAARRFFPFSPAKEGPFSGRGYTTYSGRALVQDWAKGIEDATPKAVRAVEGLMDLTNSTATAEWNGRVDSESFGITGSVYEGVMAAFNGSRLQVDGNGMAKLVNKRNQQNIRR